MVTSILEIVFHFDKYIGSIVNEYYLLAYLLLFLIIFFETGIVITPFLPGDSLLFAAGALAAADSLKIEMLIILIFIAAILGDALNYHIGKLIGPKIFKKESSLLFNKEYLARAREFYEKHGKKTIVLARFIPIIRTFAPFVAGIGSMPYKTFLVYNVAGSALWVFIFIFGGFLFGNITFVKENFGLVIIAIIFISLAPVLKEIIVRLRKNKRRFLIKL